ncbi:MAG TPA: FtsX-like permease family protein, partial [Steroidobacteraceae bacterium]|nr:FtsX-like permease family protein [Steroidobacteraceae bacterium]
IIMNQSAQFMLGTPHAGDTISLTVEGHARTFHVAGVVRQIVTLPAVYVPAVGYQSITSTFGAANAVHVATSAHDAAAIARTAAAIDARLADDGIHVLLSISETQMDGAVGGHVKILVVALIAMSALMAAVGVLGLASAQGTNVAERTREFGIMRAIGGTRAVIVRNIIAEGVFTALMSVILAVALGLPLALIIGTLVGRLSFGLALPLLLSFPALGFWIVAVSLGAVAASLPPAHKAARLTIRETLSYS